MANKNKEKPNTEQASSAESKEKPTVVSELISWAVTIGAAVVIALFLTQFIILGSLTAQPYKKLRKALNGFIFLSISKFLFPRYCHVVL